MVSPANHGLPPNDSEKESSEDPRRRVRYPASRRQVSSIGDSQEESSEVHLEVIVENYATVADHELMETRKVTCAANLTKKLREIPEEQKGTSSLTPSIWRVHAHLKELDHESYEPKMVSIGPLHHGKNALMPMEAVKLEYLRQFLKEPTELYRNLSLTYLFECVLEMNCLSRIRNEYSEKISMSEEQLAEMLVIDGCFIIGYLIQQSYPHALECLGYLPKDIWDRKQIRSDLLLLECQIPFFVLDKLYSQTNFLLGIRGIPSDIVALALRFLQIELPSEAYPEKKDVRHLLHLQHLSQDPRLIDDLKPVRSYWKLAWLPIEKLVSLISASFLGLFYLILFHNLSSDIGISKEAQETPKRIPGAVELHQAGIKFKRKVIPEKYKMAGELKVSFRNGTLEIPPFLVSDSTSKKLRNLIAFEQCYRKVSFRYTDYCIFMDHLINTAEDVAILQRCGVLESLLGCDSEVAEMFNGLCKKVLWNHESSYLADIYVEVVNFCHIPQHRWRANLIHDYFHSPWTVFSVMAGVILVTFTINFHGWSSQYIQENSIPSFV